MINRLENLKNLYELWTENHKIDSENLLGIQIDNKLIFRKHVTTVGQKAGSQLNALSRIHKHNGFQE